MRVIDADELKNRIGLKYRAKHKFPMEQIYDEINKSDTLPLRADAQGKWTKPDIYGNSLCSLCSYVGKDSYRFCPQCGAQMQRTVVTEELPTQ